MAAERTAKLAGEAGKKGAARARLAAAAQAQAHALEERVDARMGQVSRGQPWGWGLPGKWGGSEVPSPTYRKACIQVLEERTWGSRFLHRLRRPVATHGLLAGVGDVCKQIQVWDCIDHLMEAMLECYY